MTVNEKDFLTILQEKMGDAVKIQPAHLGKASVRVKPELTRDVIKILLESDNAAGVSAITGLDAGDLITLMYHIRTNGAIITILTDVSKENPRVISVTDLMPGANFHEREVADLFGVVFQGHPSPGRLFFQRIGRKTFTRFGRMRSSRKSRLRLKHLNRKL